MKIMFVRVLIFLTCFSWTVAVQAAATGWQELGGGKARMAAMLDPTTMRVSGVVEIQLAPGWKTYWREPGGSGIPPSFDFSQSRQFLVGEVGYPVPRRLEAGGAIFAGYKDTVRFTFDGSVNGMDGKIVLDLLAGLCEEICIPASGQFEIPIGELMTSDPATVQLVEMARAALPAAPTEAFSILKARTDGKAVIEIEARVPAGSEPPALFAEGPPDWYLAPAQLVANSGDTALFRLDISDIPKDANPATTRLRYTLAAGNGGVEQWLVAGE